VRNQSSIAVLAGGKSLRFRGADKQKALFLGEMLGRQVVKKALATGRKVLVIGPGNGLYDDLPVKQVRDILPGCGPLSGLHAALEAADSDWVYLLACDMPYLDAGWIDYLEGIAVSEEVDAVVAVRGAYLEPFHALYSRRLAPSIRELLGTAAEGRGTLSCARLIRQSRHTLVPEDVVRQYSPDLRIFLGANNPEELEMLVRLEEDAGAR